MWLIGVIFVSILPTFTEGLSVLFKRQFLDGKCISNNGIIYGTGQEIEALTRARNWRSSPLCFSSTQSCSSPAFLSSPGLTSRSSLGVQAKAKEIILSDECRNSLLSGITKVADTVRVTLGPRGRNILLEKEYGTPIIVNDGVTIARNIELSDRKMNAGAKLIQEIATTSDDRAGDGTTSTAVLAAEIAKRGVEYVNQGHNSIPLHKGIQKVSKLIIEEIKTLSNPVSGYNDLLNIATVATSGNVVMGQVIAKAFDKLGGNAATILEDNPALEDELDFTEGYTFDRGFANPYFLLGEEKEAIEWASPSILVSDSKIDNPQSILSILEHCAKTKTPLVIIAEDFGPEAMQTFIINKMRGMLKVVAVKAPSFGERRKDYLQDIAIATGSTFVSSDVGISLGDVTVDMLGNARNVVIKKERTSIITLPQFLGSIKNRVSSLLKEKELSTSQFDKQKLGERIAALSGGIARIRIGAATETELKEKRLRYEDSINAVRAAMETGYVPGGGVTYLAMQRPEFVEKVMKNIEDSVNEELNSPDSEVVDGRDEEVESEIELQKAGAQIVLDAMSIITKQIADNAGTDGSKVVERIVNSGKPFGYGWNAKTNCYGDMIKQGVIDPAKVIMSAVEHSTSVAGLVLTTEGMMVEKEEKKKSTDDEAVEEPYE
ncbi:chaperonin 60 kDa, putative [Theileria equi strain WA]|uniref:Chaperonin 60 kDa, putative n=1 Tax=Theileria equi strain WA TaxID=1537102 RepID=L1LB75_THEEQ|nr:chaperonin 60 kDa, putative [Theileria equi strain WA]EKX72581.1 chaperonin 60 kDa, putative [Theileria equi strain WA]|eukprot:XP_004832033.1 chaperonin 60 kDa, putative [Theileria equi strain WA]